MESIHECLADSGSLGEGKYTISKYSASALKTRTSESMGIVGTYRRYVLQQAGAVELNGILDGNKVALGAIPEREKCRRASDTIKKIACWFWSGDRE